MLPVEKVAELRLDHAEGATDTRRIEAASGLAIIGRTAYVIADDEAYLAVFRDMGRSAGATVELLDVDIPDDPAERKKHKPDLESLTPLPPFGAFDHGGIIALGSGSGRGRDLGAFAVLDGNGGIRAAIQLDTGPLMEELGRRIPKLNLEGTAIAGHALRVLQRGNDPDSFNAHIDLDLDGLMDTIQTSRILAADLIVDVHEHEVGRVRGTKLCFSDADTLPDGRIVFSASAETDEEGIDGQIAGSAVGLMEVDGDILWVEPIEVNTKVEGLAVTVEDDVTHAYMVSDEDDPERPSALLRTTIPDR